jgi:hypothetical protein
VVSLSPRSLSSGDRAPGTHRTRGWADPEYFGTVKVVSVQAWTGFQEVEAPRLQDNRHTNVLRLSALRTGRLYSPGNIPGTHSCLRLCRLQSHSAAERITSMKNSNDITQVFWEERNPFPLPGFEHRFVQRVVLSLYRLHYPGCALQCNKSTKLGGSGLYVTRMTVVTYYIQ